MQFFCFLFLSKKIQNSRIFLDKKRYENIFNRFKKVIFVLLSKKNYNLVAPISIELVPAPISSRSALLHHYLHSVLWRLSPPPVTAMFAILSVRPAVSPFPFPVPFVPATDPNGKLEFSFTTKREEGCSR